jgi:hypothetical protein
MCGVAMCKQVSVDSTYGHMGHIMSFFYYGLPKVWKLWAIIKPWPKARLLTGVKPNLSLLNLLIKSCCNVQTCLCCTSTSYGPHYVIFVANDESKKLDFIKKFKALVKTLVVCRHHTFARWINMELWSIYPFSIWRWRKLWVHACAL